MSRPTVIETTCKLRTNNIRGNQSTHSFPRCFVWEMVR